MRSLNPVIILRLGAGICFIGHGMLALTAKAKFIELLATFGIEGAQAVTLLKVIGCLDLVVGTLIIFRPTKAVLQWAMFWTALTILAWGIHGDSLIDLFRRAPYFAAPFGLLMLMYGQKAMHISPVSSRRQMDTPLESTALEASTTSTVRPEQLEAIAQLDLSMICMKLMDNHEGEGWTERQCAEVAEEYRRYLHLNLLHPDAQIVPNLAVDTMWHYHILDTAAYYRDCHAIFGHILHHYPYFGMHGTADEGEFISAFDRTKMLYQQTFAMPMDGPGYLASFRG